MQPMTQILLALWAVTGIGMVAFLQLNRSAALKRQLHPPILILDAALFLGAVATMNVPRPFVFLAVPVLVVIVFLNLRNTKFCDACGLTVQSQNPIQPPTVCSGCGAPMARPA